MCSHCDFSCLKQSKKITANVFFSFVFIISSSQIPANEKKIMGSSTHGVTIDAASGDKTVLYRNNIHHNIGDGVYIEVSIVL